MSDIPAPDRHQIRHALTPSRVEDALSDFPRRAKVLDKNRAPGTLAEAEGATLSHRGVRIMIIWGRTEFYDKLILFLRRIYEKGSFVA